MDPILNPFSPGAGAPPPELVGRDELINQARLLLARVKQGRPEKSILLVGLRGVGKTVLLNKLENLAESDNYKSFLVEAHEDKSLSALIVPPLRKILFELDRMSSVSRKVRRALGVFKSFLNGLKVTINDIEVGLDIDPEKGAADSGDLEADLPELFIAVAEAAQDRKTCVAIFIDEIQYLSSNELSALIMAMHKMAQKQLPLILVGAGLPTLPGLAGQSKSYAERLFNFPEIGQLSDKDASQAIQEPAKMGGVEFSGDAIKEVLEMAKGYPYFLQEWGYQCWNHAKQSPVTLDDVKQASIDVVKRLDASFFRVRFDRLTPREKIYMRALADLGSGSQRSGDIAEKMHTTVNHVAPLRSSLIKKGMIYSPAHGDTAFTVPLFEQFMVRAMPDFG